ncbi:MAG: hypothetical protein V1774_09275 [Candidatus Eisenbacteria bacterium]
MSLRAPSVGVRSILAFLGAFLAAGCGQELPRPAGTSPGYERTVIAELFTTVWCGNCGYAEEALDRLHEEEGPARLAVIHWHPSFGQGDPFAFTLADERVTAYRNFFGDQLGVPVCVFNGLAAISEGSPASYDRYRTRHDLEAVLNSPALLEITSTVEGNLASLELAVSGYPGSEPQDLDLFAVVVEHEALNPGTTGAAVMSYVARAGRSEAVVLAGGETLTRTMSFTLDPSWKRADLSIVAFLQRPVGETDREIVQAAMEPIFPPDEDFYDFDLSAPALDIGIPTGGSRRIDFSLVNTGTLHDTLAIDLPAALRDAPNSWEVSILVGSGETPLELPALWPLAAGASAQGLSIQLLAPDAGVGTVGLAVASVGESFLADTLTFNLTAGDYGFDLHAAETEIRAVVCRAELASFRLTSEASLDDSIAVSLPVELVDMPSGWTLSLATVSGGDLPAPSVVTLPAGAEGPPLRLKVTATTEGVGRAGLVAQSLGQPSLVDTLFFDITARLYDFSLTTDETAVWMVAGTPARLALALVNRGVHDDLIVLDLPAELQTLPAGWRFALVYADSTEVATPHGLLVESDQRIDQFGIRVEADSSGVGTAVLVARSTGDPRLADTLSIHVTADRYGLQVTAPQGSEVDLAIDTPVLLPARIANTGTLNDILIVDSPAPLQSIPDGWELYWTDAEGVALALPRLIPLSAGATTESVRLHARASAPGTATIGLVAASTNLPALADTLIFTLRAESSEYRFDLSAAETEVHGTVGEFLEAPFELTNTGLFEDTILLQVSSLENPHPWELPIICNNEGLCYGPVLELEGVAVGAPINEYVVDVRATSATTVRVRLTATSTGDPTFSRAVDFTFVAGAGKWKAAR